MHDYIGLLQKNILFSKLDNKEISGMLSCLKAKLITVKKNNYIVNAGDEALYMGILLEGEAQILKDDIWGNRTVISSLGAGDLFAEVFACAGVKILPVSVIAIMQSKVLFLDYKRVISTCSESCIYHHKLIENMLRALADKNMILNQKIDIISARTTRDKILSYLNFCAGEAGSKVFTISLNRQQLADYLCVDRSAMSAELGRMRDEALIRFRKNYFELLDK